MKKVFIEGGSRYMAKKECLWAAHIVKVCGGWMAFESIDDWQTWKTQK